MAGDRNRATITAIAIVGALVYGFLTGRANPPTPPQASYQPPPPWDPKVYKLCADAEVAAKLGNDASASMEAYVRAGKKVDGDVISLIFLFGDTNAPARVVAEAGWFHGLYEVSNPVDGADTRDLVDACLASDISTPP